MPSWTVLPAGVSVPTPALVTAVTTTPPGSSTGDFHQSADGITVRGTGAALDVVGLVTTGRGAGAVRCRTA